MDASGARVDKASADKRGFQSAPVASTVAAESDPAKRDSAMSLPFQTAGTECLALPYWRRAVQACVLLAAVRGLTRPTSVLPDIAVAVS